MVYKSGFGCIDSECEYTVLGPFDSLVWRLAFLNFRPYLLT